MPYITENYYSNTYYGIAVPIGAFNQYEARAEEIINEATRYRVYNDGISSFPALIQTLIQKAVCAQIEFYVTQGIEVAQGGILGEGFTVGKVSVTGGSKALVGKTSMISPQTVSFLEQAGLLNPAVSSGRWWPYA